MATYFAPGRGTVVRTVTCKDGQQRRVTGGYRYDFWLFGERHVAPRGFDRRSDSEDAEAELRRTLKLQRAGVLVVPSAVSSPRFANWAGVYRTWVHSRAKLGRIKAPDGIEANISSVLRFCGRRPVDETAYVHATAPYHDLTLADFIQDPSWIRKWDEWLTAEGIAGSTRNHYNTTMSQMYKLAMMAEYRDAAGAPAYNPFRDRPRSRWKRRTVTPTIEQFLDWVKHASYHAQLAMAIAVLNPKFRLKNILQLEWSDIDVDQRLIRVWDHKTDDRGEALVAAIPEQLLRILDDARCRHPHARRVILYRGKPVNSIDEAVKSAAIAAGLAWGRAGGVTFHAIRHFASTQMARMKIPADLRKNVTGHRDLQMELWYTHLFPDDERGHTEALSEAVQIAETVTAGTRQARRPRLDTQTATHAPAGLLNAGSAPGLSRAEVGLSEAVGTPVGLYSPKQGDLGAVGSLRALRRGPQSRAERLAKLKTEK